MGLFLKLRAHTEVKACFGDNPTQGKGETPGALTDKVISVTYSSLLRDSPVGLSSPQSPPAPMSSRKGGWERSKLQAPIPTILLLQTLGLRKTGEKRLAKVFTFP